MRVVKVLKVFFKISGIFFCSALLIGFLISFFYEKEVKQLLISELNKNLVAKINVEEFDFSVLRHFPHASFDLKNVKIEEVTADQSHDTLLYANHLTLLFNLFDLFSKDVKVKKIFVENGKINIRIDQNGKGNYHFWKSSENTDQTGAIELENIALRKVNLNYTDNKADQQYSMFANTADLAGKFSGKQFVLQTSTSLFVEKFFVKGDNYVSGRNVKINSSMSVNIADGLFNFDQSAVEIDGVRMNVKGTVGDKPGICNLDLAINSEIVSLSKLITLLPSSLKKYLSNYNTSGIFNFNSTLKGTIQEKNRPVFTAHYNLADGNFSAKSGGPEFEKLNFSGTFVSGNKNVKSYLEIPDLSASISGHRINAGIRLENFPEAYLTMSARTQLDLKDLKPFITADTLDNLSGDLAMNISFAGKVKELTNVHEGRINNILASGNIDIKNVSFNLKRNPLTFNNLSGHFSLHNNDITVSDFTGNISSSDFRFNGIFKNFVSFLLIPGQPGDVLATLTSSNINLDELLVNKSASTTQDTSYILRFNPRLLCELDVNIAKIGFRRFTASGIRGKVHLDNQVIKGRGLEFASMGGNFAMDATINAARRDSVMMKYEAKFSGVDITRLFYEMENFDQQTMTDKNVKGRVNADLQFSSAWSNDLTLNSASVKSTASITIEQGELINFTPVMAVGKYIHTSDLNHIRFSTLKNDITIADRKIYIPHMDINSSAINISVNGTHDFDNIVDYHLKLLLADVLGRKVKSNQTEFGEIEDDGLGHSKLFLSMKGPVDDPHFSYDRKATGDKIKNDIALEKTNMKGILKKEFGMFKKAPDVQANQPSKKQEMQVDWSAE